MTVEDSLLVLLLIYTRTFNQASHYEKRNIYSAKPLEEMEAGLKTESQKHTCETPPPGGGRSG